MSSSSSEAFPITAAVRSKLTEDLKPTHLEVINESHRHNVPENSETHLKVVVVSEKFEEPALQSPLKRHQYVYKLLETEMASIHALGISARTPSQWEESSQKVDPSPACRGGDGSLPPRRK